MSTGTLQGIAAAIAFVFVVSGVFVWTSCLAGVGEGRDHISPRAFAIACAVFLGCLPAWGILAASA